MSTEVPIKFVDLQNHRMAWVEKDHNDHLVSTPLLCAGSPPPDQAAQSHIQPGLKCLQGWGIHNLSGQFSPHTGRCGSKISYRLDFLEYEQWLSINPSVYQHCRCTHSESAVPGDLLLPAPGNPTSARLGSSPGNVLALVCQLGLMWGQCLPLCTCVPGKEVTPGGAQGCSELTLCSLQFITWLCKPRETWGEMFLQELRAANRHSLSLQLTYT